MIGSSDYKNMYNDAYKLYETHDYEKAIKIISRIIVKHQDILYYYSYEVYRLLGDIYLQLGNWKLCLSNYEKSGMKKYESYDRAGYFLFKYKKYEDSEYWYRKSIDLLVNEKFHEYSLDWSKDIRTRNIAQACKRLGRIYLDKNKPAIALSFFNMAKQLKVSGIKSYIKKAKQYSNGVEIKDEILSSIPKELIPKIKNKEEKIIEILSTCARERDLESPKKYAHNWKDDWKDYKMYNGTETKSSKIIARSNAPYKVTIIQHDDPRDNPLYNGTVFQYNIFNEFWNEECTEALKKVIIMWRWESFWYVADEILNVLGTNKIQRIKDRLEEHNLLWNTNMLIYYSMNKMNKLGLKYLPPKIKKCSNCRNLFFEAQIPRHIAGLIEFPAKPIEYCHNCLAAALYCAFKKPKKREHMIQDLRKLFEALKFIPPRDYLTINSHSSLPKKISRDKLIEVIPLMVEILPREVYEIEFGSWFNALIETGILHDDSRRDVYGYRTKAKDGHECRSLSEKMIDDWMFMNNISHQREPFYPVDEKLNPSGGMMADWKVGEYYIEFFGLMGNKDYEKKVKQKKDLAKIKGIKLIEVYPEDLYALKTKLDKIARENHR